MFSSSIEAKGSYKSFVNLYVKSGGGFTNSYKMATFVDIATLFLLLQVLLLFLANHVQALQDHFVQIIGDDKSFDKIHHHHHLESGTNHDESRFHVKATSNPIMGVAPKNFGGRSLLQANSFTCPQAFFIFGDSLSDTGNIQIVDPGTPLTTLNYPYGESYNFTNEPGHNRYSDGRLVLDFIAQAFGFPFFEPISLELISGFPTNFTNGVNFAYSGATSQPDISVIPFNLQYELTQFFSYKALLYSPLSQPSTPLSFLPNAAYIILEIGGNDIFYAYHGNATPQTVIATIVPIAVANLVLGVEELILNGAKTIIVGNQPPQGCNPSILTNFPGSSRSYDNNGCLIEYNEVDIVFNTQLQGQLNLLQSIWQPLGVVIIQFDFYSANIELITNPVKYGFNSSTKLQACCGYGGLYNYNPEVNCGDSGIVVDPITRASTNVNISSAPNPQEYISWDGIHFTQAAYKIIATFFLTGQFVLSPPGFNLTKLCNLNFSQF